jgi:hypothetical protein
MQLVHPNLSNERTFPNIGALPRLFDLDWAYQAVDKRDLRLDLLRGFAVFAMVVNHLGGASWFYLITGGNTFFVSAAEAFVFISGLVVGIVYGGIAVKEGLPAAQRKALQRAFTLYKVTVALTLIFGAISFAFNLPWTRDVSVSNPLTFVLDVLMLHQTLYLTDIPMLYTFMLLGAAMGLALLIKGRTHWLMLGSVGLWLLAQLFPIQVPWTISGSSTFDLAAWQMLFFGALAMGFHRDALTRRLKTLPRVPYLVLAGILLVWLIELRNTEGAWLTQIFPNLNTQAFLSGFFSKNTLAPGRLLASFIVFQFAFLATTLFWKPIRTALGWLLIPLGQNALYVYTLHVLIIALIAAVMPYLPINIATDGWLNTGWQLVIVLALWVMIQRRFLSSIVPR